MSYFSQLFHRTTKCLRRSNVNIIISTFRLSGSVSGGKDLNCSEIMKVLNVAEKNDAAKNIAGLLARGNTQKREGLSKYNKIYEFNMNLWNRNCTMVMTSVSGHLMGYDFTGAYRTWQGCHPLTLFDAPVVKSCSEENYIKIKRTLEREVRSCEALIIWTDCDREGENIGYEIIQVCQAIKPNIRIYRAIFSEITQASVGRAIQNLGQPNKAISDAVDVRSELDLRIGAAFTRFQTLRLQKVFPQTLASMLISYGSCQFPTLGFVVERFLAIDRFKSEPYWKIKVQDNHDDICVEFRWARHRLFEELPCQVLLDMCQENPEATVENVISKEKSKWRPVPLDTIELEKQGSRKLRINAKETMKIAEKLYTQGYISYPRTETNIFPKDFNLRPLVEQQVANHQWGRFAERVIQEGITPRQGKKSDQAHPPIHPTKYADNLQGNEARVYEFVVRHFLACLHKNAEGFETIVEIDIAGEKFTANGLQIVAKNYLDVYIYEKWNAKEIHIYQPRQTFMPTSIEMVQEQTSPPNLLTEADLIALMDKHGIGTDATHAEHIETIKARQYVGLKDNQYFIPGKLGIGLVMGYDNMGFQMSKPNLRSELESDLKLICDGVKRPQDVLQIQINKYREVFRAAIERANLIDIALAEYLDERPTAAGDLEMTNPPEEVVIFKCPKCGSNMTLKERRRGEGGKYIGCMGYPGCNNVVWLPQNITDVQVTDSVCGTCPGDMKKLQFKFKPGAYPILGPTYTTCIGGCDEMFNEIIDINRQSVRRTQSSNDSGYSGGGSSSASSGSSTVAQRGTGSNSRPSTSTRGNNRGGSASGRGGGSSVGLMPPPRTLDRGSGATRGAGNNSRGGGNSNRGGNTSNKRQSDDWGDWNDMSTDAKRPKTTYNRENVNPATRADDGGDYLCNCHQKAKQLTVRKDGPNKGRLFYKCAKPQDSSCNFFLWADDSDSTTNVSHPVTANNRNQNNSQVNWNNRSQNNPGPSNSARDSSNNSGEPVCTCGQPARKLTVRKEGPNHGRQFYGCPQGPSSTCKFFQWADDNDDDDNDGGGGWNNPPRGRSQGRGRVTNRTVGRGSGSRGGGGKRKCSVCYSEGHNKRNCPRNVMD